MAFSYAELVGRYRLRVDRELLLFIERSFVAPLPAAERDDARQAALAEAHGATLEVGGDGTVISASHGKELYRWQLATSTGSYDELVLEKPGGVRVVLRLLDPDRLEATQSGRPALTFERETAPRSSSAASHRY